MSYSRVPNEEDDIESQANIHDRSSNNNSIHSPDQQTAIDDLERSFLSDDDDGNDSISDDENTHLRERREHANVAASSSSSSSSNESEAPIPTTSSNPQPSQPRARATNDGVWANLNAKPELSNEKDEGVLPSYEQAAADSAPPYWETTIIAPSSSDDVYVDGLPVGNFFGFIWNMLISFSFQFIGFLLTYLLHTTHAAKYGSRAGFGITLIQYGFYMREKPLPIMTPAPTDPISNGTLPLLNETIGTNIASSPSSNTIILDGDKDAIAKKDWLAYMLMIVGWFILIRSTGEYTKVRRMERVIREMPAGGTEDRGEEIV